MLLFSRRPRLFTISPELRWVARRRLVEEHTNYCFRCAYMQLAAHLATPAVGAVFSPVVELEPGTPGPALGALGAGSKLVSYDGPRLEVSPLFQIVKQGRVRPHYSVIATHVSDASRESLWCR